MKVYEVHKRMRRQTDRPTNGKKEDKFNNKNRMKGVAHPNSLTIDFL